MAVAFVKPDRFGSIGQQMRENCVAIHCDANLGRVIPSRCWLIKAIRHRVIVIPDVYIHVAAAIIKRGHGIGR
jgi:hypothetical protein